MLNSSPLNSRAINSRTSENNSSKTNWSEARFQVVVGGSFLAGMIKYTDARSNVNPVGGLVNPTFNYGLISRTNIGYMLSGVAGVKIASGARGVINANLNVSDSITNWDSCLFGFKVYGDAFGGYSDAMGEFGVDAISTAGFGYFNSPENGTVGVGSGLNGDAYLAVSPVCEQDVEYQAIAEPMDIDITSMETFQWADWYTWGKLHGKSHFRFKADVFKKIKYTLGHKAFFKFNNKVDFIIPDLDGYITQLVETSGNVCSLGVIGTAIRPRHTDGDFYLKLQGDYLGGVRYSNRAWFEAALQARCEVLRLTMRPAPIERTYYVTAGNRAERR